MDYKYLTPNGKRVLTVRQMLNAGLDYRIVTVPLAEANAHYHDNYSIQSRFPAFDHQDTAQEALDAWAEQEGLLPFVGRHSCG